MSRGLSHGAAVAAIAPETAVATSPFDVFALALIHGCCMTILSGIRRPGFNTSNFEIKCVAATDRKSGVL